MRCRASADKHKAEAWLETGISPKYHSLRGEVALQASDLAMVSWCRGPAKEAHSSNISGRRSSVAVVGMQAVATRKSIHPCRGVLTNGMPCDVQRPKQWFRLEHTLDVSPNRVPSLVSGGFYGTVGPCLRSVFWHRNLLGGSSRTSLSPQSGRKSDTLPFFWNVDD